MNDERKPAHGGNHERAAGMETALCGATISNSDFTSVGAGRQGRVLSLLLEGEENALPAADLAQLAGYGNTRSLRAAVDGLRSKGVPILASEAGYYKPRNGPAGVAEIKRFLRRQDGRAASNRRTTRLIRAQLRALEKAPLPGQTELWQGGDADG